MRLRRARRKRVKAQRLISIGVDVRNNLQLPRGLVRGAPTGAAMEFSDSELHDMIDFLDLDPRSAAVAVARQCLDQGYESLTHTQKAVYDNYLKSRLLDPVLPAATAPKTHE